MLKAERSLKNFGAVQEELDGLPDDSLIDSVKEAVPACATVTSEES